MTPREATARSAIRIARGALVVIACTIALSGCGGARPTRTAFVDHMTAISSTPDARSSQWKAIWGCTYDRVRSDDLIDRMMELKPGENPARDLSSQASEAIVECMPSGHGASTGTTTTTSSPP
jgi:hypothetical protein